MQPSKSKGLAAANGKALKADHLGRSIDHSNNKHRTSSQAPKKLTDAEWFARHPDAHFCIRPAVSADGISERAARSCYVGITRAGLRDGSRGFCWGCISWDDERTVYPSNRRAAS